ncbi:MAG: AbrB/MazE/SpoVT family DNA-binding domain-containing protein [Verrucomicrobiota bacterium]
MSATAIREKRQTTIPADIAEAADLHPGDQVEWSFEGGQIRGRKLAPVEASEVFRDDELDPKTGLPLKGTIRTESIRASVKAGRERG